MSFFHRALLYVVRKRVRSLLLLLICLGVGTLALSGSAIREATQTAQLNVRQALGGVFTLQQNTSDPDQWVTNDVESYGSAAYYGGTPLTEELAARIQEQVPGMETGDLFLGLVGGGSHRRLGRCGYGYFIHAVSNDNHCGNGHNGSINAPEDTVLLL